MRLKALTLENFRGYKDRIKIPLQPDITGIVGRNDVGKSTILEALEIFFNNQSVKCEGGDLSVGATSKVIKIGCVFDDLPTSIIVDETVETTFASEYLLSGEGNLEIIKAFKCGAKVAAAEVRLIANHPSAKGFDHLHEAKITELRAIGKECGAAEKVQDERKCSHWRAAIWSTAKDLQLKEREIEVGKFDTSAKNIWEKIEAALPTFALFKSDRESSDGDSEAKDPMQAAVRQALEEFGEDVSAIQQRVSERVMEVANRTLDKLREMDSSLADSLTPTFKEKPKWTFSFSLEGDNGIPINKRGSGVRRLILLNFFRAESERKAGSRSVIYAVEEPETSQHPNNQELLIRSLLALSARPNTQVLVTTHVPALAGLLPTSSLLFIEKTNGAPMVSFGTDDVLERIARTLGVLPQRELAGAKAIILVEGDGDVVFLHHTATTLKAHGMLSHDFHEKRIVPVPTGGCGNLKNWVTLKTADEIGIPWGVLVDSDYGSQNPNEHERNKELIKSLQTIGKKARLTRKREPENYLLPEVVHAACNKPGTEKLTFGEFCDAKKLIAQAAVVRDTVVLERFWPKMTAINILTADEYTDESGITRHELIEMAQDFLSLV